MTTLDPDIAARLKRTDDGLVPAVVQQHDTGEVLMLAWMDDEALARTIATGPGTFERTCAGSGAAGTSASTAFMTSPQIGAGRVPP